MNKREITKTIKQLRTNLDKLEKQLKETPKVKTPEDKSYYCNRDGYRYILDKDGKYFSSYNALVSPDDFRFHALPSLDNTWAPTLFYRYTRLPKKAPKVYKGTDGNYYRLNPKGKYKWYSKRPGCSDGMGDPFRPEPRPFADPDALYTVDLLLGKLRFYSRTKKPS